MANHSLPGTADIVIVGGGIAGLSAAIELAGHRAGSIVLLEQEPAPGRQSTALNASMLLQLTDDPVTATLGIASRPFYVEPAPQEPTRFRSVGSLLLFSGDEAEARCHARAAAGQRLGLHVELLTPEAAARRVPILDASRFVAAATCSDDGVIDLGATVDALTRRAERAGIKIHCGVHVDTLTSTDNRVTGVATSAGTIAAGTVVIAAGAAAGRLGSTVGAPLPLRVTRRHLAVTGTWNVADPTWPFVWDLDAAFYFRPEARGLIWSGCDIADAVEGDTAVRPDTVAAIREKAARLIPSAASLPIDRSWAGLRTMTEDDRFAVGPDPRLMGLAWMAGLGGHGMAVGPAAGRILAQLLTGDTDTLINPALIGVDRLLDS